MQLPSRGVICSMAINLAQYQSISAECAAAHATLVAVSKTKPASDIEALYAAGQRDFGENYVQELADKAALLPPDIRWHFIGHLQSNKVKYIAPFVHLIHGVDSLKLLAEINKQALKHNRIIDCLLQVHIAREETKFGFDAAELAEALQIIHQSAESFAQVRVRGLMGMASFSDDQELVRAEFEQLRDLFLHSGFRRETDILSMGMSGDYRLALAAGSNLLRIGSLLFGARG